MVHSVPMGTPAVSRSQSMPTRRPSVRKVREKAAMMDPVREPMPPTYTMMRIRADA